MTNGEKMIWAAVFAQHNNTKHQWVKDYQPFNEREKHFKKVLMDSIMLAGAAIEELKNVKEKKKDFGFCDYFFEMMGEDK